MHDHARRTHADRDPQRQVRGRDLHRPQARPFLRQSHRRDHTRGAGGTHGVDLDQPLAQLGLQVRRVHKAPLFEKRAFHPADEVFDRAFLLGTRRPTHFNAQTEIQRDAREDRIPLGHLAVAPPRERHRLRPIEDREQRHPAKGREVIDQRAHERLDLLIGHDRDVDPARVLQPGREKMNPGRGPVQPPHIDLSEIVLGEFAGQAFEAHHRSHGYGPHGVDQFVERRLPARIPLELRSAQNLQRQHRGLGRQQLDDEATKWLRLRGPSDGSPYPLAGGVDVGDGWFSLHSLHASNGDAGAFGDVEPRVAGAA